MPSSKKPIIRYFYSKWMPADKVWALIEKVQSDFPVVKDRSLLNYRINDFETSLPFKLFPAEKIAIQGLNSINGELPISWSAKGHVGSFTDQLFQCFPTARNLTVSTSTALKGLKGLLYLSIHMTKEGYALHLTYEGPPTEPGSEQNVGLRNGIEIAQLPIILKDTKNGFTIESNMSVSSDKCPLTGNDIYTGIVCNYPIKQFTDCLKVFSGFLSNPKVTAKSLSFFLDYDNPDQGPKTLIGTANVNSTLQRFNAINPLPPSVEMTVCWSLNRYQDYKLVDDVLKLLKTDQQAVSLFEFNCRKKPVFLDVEFKLKGSWRLQFTFHEILSDDEASKALGTKVEWT